MPVDFLISSLRAYFENLYILSSSTPTENVLTDQGLYKQDGWGGLCHEVCPPDVIATKKISERALYPRSDSTWQ